MGDVAFTTSFHLERLLGEKVPQCPRYPRDCSEPLMMEPIYTWDSYRCHGCGWEIPSNRVVWIPKNEQARARGEFPL